MAIRLFSWQLVGVVGAVVVMGVVVGAIFLELKRDDWTVPDLKEMRAYRASLMSDDQIRQLNAESAADAKKYKQIDQDVRDKAFRETAARSQRCLDIVYRERNAAECGQGVPIGLMYPDAKLTPGSEQILEEAILGVCRFARTNEEARINKCLPPKSK